MSLEAEVSNGHVRHIQRQFIIINVVLSKFVPSSVTVSLVKYINSGTLLSVLGNNIMFPSYIELRQGILPILMFLIQQTRRNRQEVNKPEFLDGTL